MPHLVKDKMRQCAEGKGKWPGLASALVEIKPGRGKQDEKEKRMRKYAPVTESFFKENLPDHFIDNVGQQ